jgi:hypothetical protein
MQKAGQAISLFLFPATGGFVGIISFSVGLVPQHGTASLQRNPIPGLTTTIPGNPLPRSSEHRLLAYLTDHSTQQVHHGLLNASNLFDLPSCPPLLSAFDKRQALGAPAGLQQYIKGAGKGSFPGNRFRKGGFVKNIIVYKGGGEHQVVGPVWPASDKLVVHCASFPFKVEKNSRIPEEV